MWGICGSIIRATAKHGILRPNVGSCLVRGGNLVGPHESRDCSRTYVVIGMLFTLRQSRRAFTVPVLGLAGAGAASYFALRELFAQRISPELVLAAGFSVVLFAVFVTEVRTLRIRRDNRLFVRSLLGGGGAGCAVG